MTQRIPQGWTAVLALSFGIALGASAMVWSLPDTTLQTAHIEQAPRYDEHFARLEQAVTTLTQSLERRSAPSVATQPVSVVAPFGAAITQESLTKLLRQELQNALDQWNPEAHKERALEIANAKLRDTPENKAAYQSATSVVRTAVAAKRWTDEDAQTLRLAIGQLTREQHDELMELLIPAINSGEIKVETKGPLF